VNIEVPLFGRWQPPPAITAGTVRDDLRAVFRFGQRYWGCL